MRAITQVAFGQASSALRVTSPFLVSSRVIASFSFLCGQLSSIPRPVPNTNEVLLRILASSVNALDVRMVSGYGRCPPAPNMCSSFSEIFEQTGVSSRGGCVASQAVFSVGMP
jgi:hypothetical protein